VRQVRRRPADHSPVLLALALAVALVSVPLAGGRPGAIADVTLRLPWLLLGALGVQVLITSVVAGGNWWLHDAAHVASYAMAGAWVLANRRVPGLLLLGLGGALNLCAIVANGGVMPADPDALRTAAVLVEAGEFNNSAALADPRLEWLGDVFATPASWPGANVFSVGDVVIVLGAAWGLHRLGDSAIARVAVSCMPGRARRAAAGA
jgi:hypothetical protein